MIYYDQAFFVKKWIICTGLNDKQKEVLSKIIPKKVVINKWLAAEYKDELLSYAKEGYAEQVHQKMPFFLDMVLALRAAISLTRKANGNAQLSPKVPYQHLLDRRMTCEADYERLFNEILSANDDITLSQIFGLAENTADIWLTFDGCERVIRKVARQVVTVGNGENFEVNLTDKTGKDLITSLAWIFKE